jgi:co-chaperonin GroES (HSP10)
MERVKNDMTTSSGILLTRSDDGDKARVLAIGPDVDEVAVGDIVLVNWNKSIRAGENFIAPVTEIVFVFE